MASTKTIIVVSPMIDNNIKSYQTDKDFILFKSISAFGKHVEKQTIRADVAYITSDSLGTATSTSMQYLVDKLTSNDFVRVDEVYFIAPEDDPSISVFNFMVENSANDAKNAADEGRSVIDKLEHWHLVTGPLTVPHITSIINGTNSDSETQNKYKAVYRVPRAEYLKAKMQQYSSMDDHYVADEEELQEIPDVEVPDEVPVESFPILEKLYITGENTNERTAFALVLAQYLAQTGKTLIVEPDPEYHRLTEFITKAGIEAECVQVKELFNKPREAMERIKNTKQKLVVITCIDKCPYVYDFVINLLYYNLIDTFRYLIIESGYEDVPENNMKVVVVPDTMDGILKAGQLVEPADVAFCNFVAVDLGALPETHIPSSKSVADILNDLIGVNDIKCTVFEIASLRLKDKPYDLGSVVGTRIVRRNGIGGVM